MFHSDETGDGYLGEYTARQAIERLIASKRLVIPPFSPHDLRRTVATGLAGLGVHQELIGLVLGHRKHDVTSKLNGAAVKSTGVSDRRWTAIVDVEDREGRRAQLRAQREAQAHIAGTATPAGIEAAIAKHKTTDAYRWQSTRGCDAANITSAVSRAFCGALADLQAKLAAARARDSLSCGHALTSSPARRPPSTRVLAIFDKHRRISDLRCRFRQLQLSRACADECRHAAMIASTGSLIVSMRPAPVSRSVSSILR